jgi:hypothetical protein
VAALSHFCHRSFAYFIVPENLSQGGSEINTAASAGRKTPEREKLSGRQKSAGEIPSQRGEIVAIVIIIRWTSLGSSSPAASSTPSPRHPAVTSWVESCQILRGNFPDVDYSCG